MPRISAADVSVALDGRKLEVLHYLFPQGKVRGHEFEVGDLEGRLGRSLKVNLDGKSGVWADFNGGTSGGDLLDLWARARCEGDIGAAIGEASTFLGLKSPQREGWAGSKRKSTSRHKSNSKPNSASAPALVAPVPAHAPLAPAHHPQLGAPAARHEYVDARDQVILFVDRYETPKGKQIRPLSLWRIGSRLAWQWKAIPGPRPLYRLNDLAAHPDKEILFVEGEKAADAAAQYFPEMVVTTWPGGTGGVDHIDLQPLVGRKVRALWPDADIAGQKAMVRLAERLRNELNLSARIVQLPEGLPQGFDLADSWPLGWTLETVQQLIDCALDLRGENLANLETIDASDLLDMTFPEPRWIVAPYITEGLSILAGRPKIGKSWLALGIAIAVAAGRAPLGNDVAVEQGEVLYLGLEDNKRRLQRRMKVVLQGEPMPRGLSVATQCRRFDDGGIEDLSLWLEHHPRARLIVVDTFIKVRPPRQRNADMYSEDYAAVTAVKNLADKFNVAVVIVHHLRKSTADDPLDEVSGSTGFTAGADSVLVLKRDRGQADAVLHATGRDIEEIEHALQFEAPTGRWSVLGNADEFRQTAERRAIIDCIKEAGTPLKAKEIAERLGKQRSNVSHLLRKLKDAGVVQGLPDGTYAIRPI